MRSHPGNSGRNAKARERLRGQNRITELLDQTIFTESAEELQTILQIYDQTFTRFGLFNSKTEKLWHLNVD